MHAHRVVNLALTNRPATRLLPLSLLTVGLLLLLPSHGSRVAGQPPVEPPAKQPDKADALPPLDPEAVDRAIQEGVRFLRQNQKQQGHWGAGTGPGSGRGWAVGYTALAGLTLVECGVSTDDPGLQAARRGVRSYANELDSTYEVALAILFLDRMGNKSDKQTIQILAARLIAGQTATGGWGYKVPRYTNTESEKLSNALRKLSPSQPVPPPSPRVRPLTLPLCIKSSDDTFQRPSPPFDARQARKDALGMVPANMQKLPVLQEPDALSLDEPMDHGTTSRTGPRTTPTRTSQSSGCGPHESTTCQPTGRSRCSPDGTARARDRTAPGRTTTRAAA